MTPRGFARGLLHSAVILLAVFWFTTLVTLVVLLYRPGDSVYGAMSFWQTGIFLLVTLPVLYALARWAFRRAPRYGPQADDDDGGEPEQRPRHPGLSGEHEPPIRW